MLLRHYLIGLKKGLAKYGSFVNKKSTHARCQHEREHLKCPLGELVYADVRMFNG